ncbi:hypothetical protein GUA87_08880 [Sneathiella sp. P13V-1]|uniref:hypothetical protein n=1 Tax=Sneathiella sp. P13V-1 TaxID=2697366 RepID=UPI00187BAE1B|nr:hypothetical protein [Sneathiella sp. P13V-1]MBE7636957.1 hypothetical protein [Sneathiella sp. P13V-1]
MDYPIKNMDEVSAADLNITLDGEGRFDIQIKEYVHSLSEEELLAEMKDQLDVRGSVRNALLRKAQKEILSGLKRGRRRMNEEALEVFDLNVLIWFADKALKGEHAEYLAK